ncbi:hypothetical protein AB0L53_58500 [Nonomuraea sp. NPDC052129]|uniref:hypothetical protein n=1 Tax=Nonomuraea sp. NPDC052129 TaxID=3154651 RepID=UPI0034401F6B
MRCRAGLEQLTEAEWRERWQAERWFLQADGESGKRYGNETIQLTPDGQVSIKLPAPLAHLANAGHGRYVLSARVCFAHRGQEWAERIEVNRAVAYRIHLDVSRGRWYLTASWQHQPTPTIPLRATLAGGVIGVDTNADHLAAWRLDVHGNPIGNPRRFDYDSSGSASRRDAQLRHALTRLLHWARGSGVRAIAVDPAYTSRWGAQHWQHPLTSPRRQTSRHDAAAVAIARRAQQYPIRRRTPPPPHDQSDRAGHRSVQADRRAARREENGGPSARLPGRRG